MEEQEFIVAYAPGWCEIAAVALDSSINESYEYALARHRNARGDIVNYNNQQWCSVMAENSKDALDKFFAKIASENKGE